jgi:hypothetical protein
LLGTGLALQLVGSGCLDTKRKNVGTKTTLAPLTKDKEAGRQTVRAIPVTRVAPILQEALANDGRGGFGCVAVTAPVFLSENEALDLIQAELEKAGLKLRDIVNIDGLQIPDPDRSSRFEMSGEKSSRTPRVKKLVKGAYTFDLGTEDKSVAIKFLQHPDYDKWKADQGRWSSYESYNLAWLATQVGDAFKQRDTGAPVVIGLFFDPMVYPREYEISTRGLNREQAQFARDQAKEDEAVAGERAREKLRKQVSHFVDYLKQEGVVE